MHLDNRRCRLLISTLGVVIPLLASLAPAADPPDKTTGNDESVDSIREQSIYIPYSKLREIFEKTGRGVFLPYEEFQKLWQAARDATRPPTESKPPVEALITEVENEATISKDVVQVRARVKIEVLAEGWHEIPLRLSDAAITQATIGEQPARILFDQEAGYKLLVEKRGKQAELLELALEYAKAFTTAPGQNSVSFQAPQAPVSRWRIRIPQAGVKVNIHPLIAATEVPEGVSEDKSTDQTVVLAFVGATPTVRIDWTPKAEGATGLEALASVRCEQQAWVDQGVARTRSRLTYDISRAELNQLLVEVPADYKIAGVFDANVRQWSVEKVDDHQRITVQLFEPAKEKQSVTIELEKFAADRGEQDLKVPVVNALGVGRQQGLVVVQIAEGLRAEATKHTSLLQIDAAELPESLQKGKWSFSYRYVALPFDLTLRIEKVEPRIVVDSLVEAHLDPRSLTLNMFTVYDVQRAGVFQLELDIPSGYMVSSVRGRASGDVQAVDVDTHHLGGKNKTHLVVNLSRKAFQRVGLEVKLHKSLREPDLLGPTGKTVEIPLDIPRVSPTTVERVSGRLVVLAPESLRINPSKIKGLRSISFKEAFEGMESMRDKPSEQVREVLAYAYTQEEAGLALVVERRKPHVTTRQLLVAQIEAGVVKYEATFFYDILYSGVKSLTIGIPADLAGEIRNNTPSVREEVVEPPPEGLTAGYVAWNFTGETEFIGSAAIKLVWEKKIAELDIGKSVELQVPHLKPWAVDRAWGQIVLTKAETIDVHESGEPRGIRPIDPQHDLMDGAKVAGAARAFEFHDDWSLSITVTRYQLEEVKRTSIERAVVQMVVTRSGQTSVQALYRMRSAHQRLAVKLPDNLKFDSEPLRINGRAVALERGDKNDFFVPLADQNADEPFLLELRYTVHDSGMKLICPEFPSEPAVQKVYVCAYLPGELVYLGSIGPWSDELRWRWTPVFDFKPVSRGDKSGLIAWVCQDINVPGNTAETFHTDGQLYLFSTLRPPPGPEGSLRLVAMDEDWLNVLVLTPVILGGLVLLRTKISTRWLAIGGLIVLLVLAGIFMPTFSRQIIDGKLLSAIFIVLVIWQVHYVVWIRPNDPVLLARKKAREEQRLARVGAKISPAPPVVEKAEPPPSTPERGSDEEGPPPGEGENKRENKEGGSSHA